MSNKRARRAGFLAAIVVVALGFGISLVKVFNENLVFFYTPTQILAGDTPTGLKSYRIGGMVQEGSLQRANDSLRVSLFVSDKQQSIPVVYTGSLPDLFKEGTGVVADGNWDGQTFTATEVLAKHDEEYMPPGVEQ